MTSLAGVPRPERAYLVCATPRSGSTLLCDALASTGVAGRPEEYFEARRETGSPSTPADYFESAPEIDPGQIGVDVPDAPEYSSLRGVDDYRDHLRTALRSGTTENGVFGTKLMWGHLHDFVPLARSLPELAELDLRPLLEAVFAEPSYVWVRRGDTVRQAVSLWRALQTQSWHSGGDAGGGDRDPRYDFAAIHHLRMQLTEHDAAWEAFFDREGIRPLILTYEEMAADPGDAVGRVLALVGVDSEQAAPPSPSTRRQADELSEQWVNRYREMIEAT